MGGKNATFGLSVESSNIMSLIEVKKPKKLKDFYEASHRLWDTSISHRFNALKSKNHLAQTDFKILLLQKVILF